MIRSLLLEKILDRETPQRNETKRGADDRALCAMPGRGERRAPRAAAFSLNHRSPNRMSEAAPGNWGGLCFEPGGRLPYCASLCADRLRDASRERWRWCPSLSA